MNYYGYSNDIQNSSSLHHNSSPNNTYMNQHPPNLNADARNPYRGYEQAYPHHHYGVERSEMIERIEPNINQYPPYLYPAGASWHATTYNMNNYALHTQRQPKQKRARMSLQKRLLVNARERERMRVLNKAFESLRDVLPCYIADGHMAKITTLRLAINYIKALTDLLNEQKIMENKSKLDSNIVEKSQEELFSSILKDTKLNPVVLSKQYEDKAREEYT